MEAPVGQPRQDRIVGRPGGLTALTTLAVLTLAAVVSCTPGATTSQTPTDTGSAPPSVSPSGGLVITGRIVTMDEPPLAEALLIEEGTVTAIGGRDDVLALAGEGVPVIDLGDAVAYPGFIDAHAHWIGDREYYALGSAAEAMDAALARGWTSISEQWVNPERLDELTALAADNELPLRVDAYLALNFDDQFFGDWYIERKPGAVDDRLRVRGVKIHLDSGRGDVINWEASDLTETIGRADEAGWQVSVHSASTGAQDLVLDAYEAALGPTGPNPFHHRIEHALEVSDEQLTRMVAMDLVVIVHPDGGTHDWVRWTDYFGLGTDYPAEQVGWLTRLRDFVDAGLHVAAATDAPWFFPDFALADDIGRPIDHIAAGMDGRPREYPDTPAWVLEQLWTAEQGLRAVTIEAAYALADESRRGHLAVGTLGDVTIVSGDVLAASADEIRALDIVATIVGGIVSYCADPAVCGQR